MRDILKRIQKLEEVVGDPRCICIRDSHTGGRFFSSTSQAECDQAAALFSTCLARHAAGDESLVVRIMRYGDDSHLINQPTGAPPLRAMYQTHEG